MRASYDSIDNKQKMCEKVNKDITFIQFFHSTRLHSNELLKIFFSLLTLQLLFCKKLVGREKMFEFEACVLIRWLANTLRETANQNAKLKVKNFSFNVQLACFSYGQYSFL